MKNFIPKNQGFTIIETLVAVAILMISIAGPLTIAQKGLTAAVYARDQSVASFLAQDAIEYIKNYRDNGGFENIKNASTQCSSVSSLCSIDTTVDLPQNLTNTSCTINNTCFLYRGNEGYSPNTSGTKSQFSRGYFITKMNNPDELKVTVTVAWNNGTVSNVVTLENELFNIP